MKKILLFCFIVLTFTETSFSQLTGSKTIPGNYASIALAIADLNFQGVGTGGVSFNVAAGYTETISAPLSITATGTITNPILFQKSGAGSNPAVIAYTGTSTPASAVGDGIWNLVGCDYVTIDAIDLVDPNTTNPATMEYGYALFKAGTTDGCQNNTIKNCTVTLNRANNASGSGPSPEGSKAIDVTNALFTSQTTSVIGSSAAGSNSNNKFYSNTLQNCNIGIALTGFTDVAPFTNSDTGNDIGGNASSTGNNILNFGGASAALNPSAGISTYAQYNLNVSYNIINNNNGSGVNHVATLRGIYTNTAANANTTVTFNTITLKSGGTNPQVSAIENSSGANGTVNTINLSHNSIQNCSNDNTITGTWYGIYNSASASNLDISFNTFTGNTSKAISGNTWLIYNTGAVPGTINMTNNNLSFSFTKNAAYAGNIYSVYNNGGTPSTTLNMNSNDFSNYTFTTVSGIGSIYYCYNANGNAITSISNNTWTNLTINNSGPNYLMCNNTSTQVSLNVNNNSIVTGYTRTAGSGDFYIYYSNGNSSGTSFQTFSGNNFSNITSSIAGAGEFRGFWNNDGYLTPFPKKMIFNNIFSNINYNTSGPSYIMVNCGMGDGSTASGSSVFNNTIANITVGGWFHCMSVSDPLSPTHPLNVYGNVIRNIATTSASDCIIGFYYGADMSGMNFYNNKITGVQFEAGVLCNISAIGFYSWASSYFNIWNNYIGDISAPHAATPTLEPSVSGFYIVNASTVNMYYNTVYLNATSSGSNFGSAALFADANTHLTLRSNIFVNLSSSNGIGRTIGFQHSQTYWYNYGALSNNNDFYAGPPGPNNLIMSDGTNSFTTLAGFKAFVAPRDSNSVTENPPFLSVLGSDAHYLHITPSIPTQIESGGAGISNYPDDYDGDPRQGTGGYTGTGSAPDIGADEFNGLPVNFTNPTLSGPTTVCTGSAGNVYTTETGMSNYAWSVSAGGTITSGGGPSDYTATVTWNTAGAGTISVNYKNEGGQSAPSPTVLTVTVNALPVPSITGQTSMCVNSGYYVYSTEPGMTDYTWTLSPGGLIMYGTGTNQVQVSWIGSGNQTVSVTYSNGAGCNATIPAVLNITVSPLPGPCGTISGSVNVCEGENGVAYSVAPITNTTTYVWTLPSNAIIVSGTGTNAITVNFDTAAVSGNIHVYGNNICGNGEASPAFGVIVTPVPETPVITNNGYILTSNAPTGNQWYYEGNLIAGATGQTYDASLTGTGFYWDVVMSNGCSSDTSNHKLVITTGIGSHSSPAISIFPVPNDGKFNILLSSGYEGSLSIRIYNGLGIIIYEEKDKDVSGLLRRVIDLNPAPAGVYTMVIQGNDCQAVRKIVVNK